jgi:hypothetical protein
MNDINRRGMIFMSDVKIQEILQQLEFKNEDTNVELLRDQLLDLLTSQYKERLEKIKNNELNFDALLGADNADVIDRWNKYSLENHQISKFDRDICERIALDYIVEVEAMDRIKENKIEKKEESKSELDSKEETTNALVITIPSLADIAKKMASLREGVRDIWDNKGRNALAKIKEKLPNPYVSISPGEENLKKREERRIEKEFSQKYNTSIDNAFFNLNKMNQGFYKYTNEALINDAKNFFRKIFGKEEVDYRELEVEKLGKAKELLRERLKEETKVSNCK